MASTDSQDPGKVNVIDDEGNEGSIFSALNLLEAEQQLKDIYDTRNTDQERVDQLQELTFHELVGHKPKKGYTAPKFDRARQLRYLRKLASTGNQALACAYTPVSRKTIMLHKKANKWFQQACDDALANYGDLVEAEVIRRATKGVKRPVFQKGVLVGHERVYSDSLLALVIKSKKPEYRDKLNVDANITGGVLVVPPMAVNEEEWNKRYGHLQRPHTDQEQVQGEENQETQNGKPKTKVQTITRG